jgi:hypothetical protein
VSDGYRLNSLSQTSTAPAIVPCLINHCRQG